MSDINGRPVYVAGGGLHPFGRYPEKTYQELATEAASKALEDAGVGWNDIQLVLYSKTMPIQPSSAGALVGKELGLTGVPIIGNIENACSSSSSAVWLACRLIGSGVVDRVMVIGAEKMPRGPLMPTEVVLPDFLLGTEVMMALYALRARRYMRTYGAPIASIAQVSVKNHRNGVKCPYAQFKKEFTLEEVLNSRKIADPLTLYQCCPTTDGAAALVLTTADSVRDQKGKRPLVRVAGSAIATEQYHDRKKVIPSNTMRAAAEAYKQAEIMPKDVDLAEVHDAATIGEILQMEALGLCPEGEGWKYTLEGKTEIGGSIPVSPSGGLQAHGHPLGATGARQIAEAMFHLRGEAGERQVKDARVAVTQTAGFGGITCVHVLVRED